MKINLKARFRNKTFVVSTAVLTVSLIYKVLSLFNIVPAVSESEIAEVVTMAVDILALVGVCVDPTTEGISDSERAMTYYTDEDMREVK
jgi:phi LC3 family holin